MLRHILCLLISCLAGASFVAQSQPAQAADDWAASVKLPPGEQATTLFNGKDLTGWDGDSKFWSVENGVIVGKNEDGKQVPSSTYLFTEKKYRNFRLLFEIKQSREKPYSHMHSGVCMLGERFIDKGDNQWGFKGPLILACNDWGLYDAYGLTRNRRLYPPNNKGAYRPKGTSLNGWNQVEILVTGNRIRMIAGGVEITDFTDSPEMLKPSQIGLQLHSNADPQHIEFRGLRIVENPVDTLATVKVTPKKQAPATEQSSSKQPNILFIMSDDHTTTGIGCYGGRLASLNPTPNIDRLAKEGVRLTNCFCTNSICTPSRATIMSGQYSHKNGVTTLKQRLPPGKHSLPRLIKEAGYETAMIGKWHLSVEPSVYNYYCVLPGQGFYHNPQFRIRGAKPWPQNEIRVNKHSSDAITDISLSWLKARKQKDKPFFLMHHFKAPHDNFENAERYDFLYEDAVIPEPASLRQRAQHGPADGPLYGTSVSKRNQRRNMGHHMFVDEDLPDDQYTGVTYQRYMKKFLRTVKGVDDNIGRLLAHLESTGELDNTIIVYTADQGFMLGEHDYIDKRWMYEESLRMPYIIRYPERFKPGTTNDDLINNVDFAPTLIELAGNSAAIERLPEELAFQGHSFVANLEGTTPEDWRKASYYRYWMHMEHHDNPAHFGIRTNEHKLILFYGRRLNDDWYYDLTGLDATPPHWELYDLKKDPNEQNNVVNDPTYAETLAKLRTQLYELKTEVGDTDDQYPEVRAMLDEVR